jgi:hypothetical protein
MPFCLSQPLPLRHLLTPSFPVFAPRQILTAQAKLVACDTRIKAITATTMGSGGAGTHNAKGLAGMWWGVNSSREGGAQPLLSWLRRGMCSCSQPSWPAPSLAAVACVRSRLLLLLASARLTRSQAAAGANLWRLLGANLHTESDKASCLRNMYHLCTVREQAWIQSRSCLVQLNVSRASVCGR